MRDKVDYLSNVDKRQTIKKVAALLNDYRKAKRIAPDKIDLQYTPISEISDLGKYALKELRYLDRAIDALEEKEKTIITMRYTLQEELSDIEIYNTLHIAESSYYRSLRKAHLEFAQCYRKGKLLVYED